MPKILSLRQSRTLALMEEIGVENVDALILFCDDALRSRERVRIACSIIGLLRVRSGIPCLLRRLAEEDVSPAAAVGIGLVGSKTATRRLILLAKKTSSEIILQSAITALGMLSDRRAEGVLCNILLGSPSADNRRLAARALTSMCGRAASPVRITSLVKGLSDDSPAVRWQVLSALGASNDSTVIDSVKKFVCDDSIVASLPEEENTVSWAARNALRCLGGE